MIDAAVKADAVRHPFRVRRSPIADTQAACQTGAQAHDFQPLWMSAHLVCRTCGGRYDNWLAT